jgi:hypothetical protein
MQLSIKRHTSKLRVVRLNHAPPSMPLLLSSLHSVTRCRLKKVECRDFLMQTSPVIPYLKIRITYITVRSDVNRIAWCIRKHNDTIIYKKQATDIEWNLFKELTFSLIDSRTAILTSTSCIWSPSFGTPSTEIFWQRGKRS